MSAALISAGASLLGGFFNRSATRKANEKNRPENQVREWEQAGINPIFGLSSGSYVPHQASMIGDSFAAAGAQYARSLDLQHEKELRETQIELENERLRLEIDKMSRPSEPGHMKKYGGILPLPGQNEIVPQEKTRTEETFVTDGGNEIDIPIGPDFDELVSGKIIDYFADRKRVRERTRFNQSGLGGWRNPLFVGPDSRPKRTNSPKPSPPYFPGLNPPLRGYYGKPGSRTGF